MTAGCKNLHEISPNSFHNWVQLGRCWGIRSVRKTAELPEYSAEELGKHETRVRCSDFSVWACRTSVSKVLIWL